MVMAVAAAPLCASGQREDPVQTARELIGEGRTNEAIMLLQDTIRRNPDRIEEAERLLSQVRRVRTEYNDLLEELIEHLNRNPEDIVTTLEIIDRMEALDQAPNQRIADQVTLARVVAQLAYDRSIADQIMADAAEHLAQGRYGDAVERYLSGFSLQRDAFERRQYPAVFVAGVEGSVDRVRSEAGTFNDRLPRKERVYADFIDAVQAVADDDFEGDIEVAIRDALAGYATLLEEFARSERVSAEAAETIRGYREAVPGIHPEDPVDWHLTLLERFIFGDTDDRGDGILGAMRLLRLRQTEELSSAFHAARAGALAAAEQDYAERRWEQAHSGFENVRLLSDYALQMVVAESGEDLETLQVERAAELLSDDAYRIYLLHHAGYHTGSALAGFSVGLREVDGAMRLPEASAADLAARRALLADAVQVLDEERELWRSARSEYRLEDQRLSASAAEMILRTDDRIVASHAEARETETDTVRRYGRLRLDFVSEGYERNQNVYQTAVRRIEGVEAEVEDGDDNDEAGTLVYRFPSEARDDLLEADAELEGFLADAGDLLETLEQEPQYVLTDQVVRTITDDVRDLLERMQSLRGDIAEATVEAEQRIARALELRQQGERLAQQTEQALAALDVPRARNLWEQVRESFFESLEVQQDPQFRRQADARIVALGVRLQEAENELIVQRVRELIGEADRLYRLEDYRGARAVLSDARETWARTNVDPNPEIERLDRFVTAALTMENRRTLVATEPLYPVLSTYLNLAQNDYDRAREVLRSTGLEAAQPFLARAEQNLENVTAVRPYNWEARLLRLEILRVVESENFDALFETRVAEAWQLRNQDPTEALVDLQALHEINPDYPNLRSRIEQLEIELGIRPDPISQAQIARSNQLLQQARNLAAGGGAAQVRAAITALEEAVTLNPENNQAKVLLDTLRIGTGGQAAVALSSEDEQQFRRAENLFVEGNVAQAFAIVERLLQTESNRLYPPLLSLRQRITARLGI